MCRSIREMGEKVEDEDDDRDIASLRIEQLEFADVVIINKVLLILNSSSSLTPVFSQTWCPKSISAKSSHLCTPSILAPRSSRPTMELSSQMLCLEPISSPTRWRLTLQVQPHTLSAHFNAIPGWLLSLQEGHVPESEEFGITSFIYERQRPFHPER